MLRNAFLLFAGLTIVACGRGPGGDLNDMNDVGSLTPQTPPMAHVALVPTAGHAVAGSLMLTERANGNGVAITGNISGLTPDTELAFHVHEVGDCTAPDATSAGEHFNPAAQPHGEPDSERSHVGDLPNIEADSDGVAEIDITVDDVALTGSSDRSLLNRAIIVHAAADDFETQPAGDSGARIACGVIASSMPSDVPMGAIEPNPYGASPAPVDEMPAPDAMPAPEATPAPDATPEPAMPPQ